MSTHKIASKYSPVQILFKMGYTAFTFPFNKTVYYRDSSVMTSQRSHEDVHLAQIEDEGAYKFSAKYLYYLVRYGYTNNPYEVEARSKA